MNAPLLKLEAIIFDFDGTMAILNIDFAYMRARVMEHLYSYDIESHGIEHLYILELIIKARDLLAERHPGTEARYYDEAMHLIQTIEMDAAREGRLIESTEAMLQTLRGRGIKTGVVTRNCREALECVFPGVYKATDVVLSRDHIERVKPDKEHLLHALRSLGAHAGCAAMVGDHPMDMILARSVGTKAIGVLTGSSGKDALISSGADMVFEKAADLMPYLI
ncbi:MAG: phosphoglycolate phosphatase [Syntrophus sp. SKADARSKE-3]|nr:phosphoglycolate phosphatase [Syntrophus sp. SKADARSKE-3]